MAIPNIKKIGLLILIIVVILIINNYFINSNMNNVTEGFDCNFSEGTTEINKCNAKNEITIPSSVTNINESAFYNYQFSTIRFSNNSNLKTIGNYAFNLSKITSITLPSTVTEIGEYAFENSSLKSIIIPSSVTKIGQYAFACEELETVIFEGLSISNTTGNLSKLQSISEGVFYSTKIQNINLPASVTEIGKYAFFESQLKSIEITQNVSMIGDRAFSNCKYLTEIKFMIESKLTSINIGAFSATKITSIIIPKSVAFIGEYAFSKCLDLKEVIFMERSSSIDIKENAFAECNNIISVTNLPNNYSLQKLFKDSSTPPTMPTTPAPTTPMPTTPMPTTPMPTTQMPTTPMATTPAPTTPMPTTPMATTFKPIGCNNTIIPVNTILINDNAFKGCTNLVTIRIPSSVLRIGISAFEGCTNLKFIIFENNSKLVSIGGSAFKGTKLEKITNLPDTFKSLFKSLFKSVKFNP